MKEFDYERIVEIAGNNTNSAIFGTVLVICFVHDVSEVEEKLYLFEHIVVVGLDLFRAETLDDEIAILGYILNRKMNFGPGNVVGLTYWAKIFHPDVDLDPEAVYREYLEKFQGLEFQEDKMVVYPKMARFCDKTS